MVPIQPHCEEPFLPRIHCACSASFPIAIVELFFHELCIVYFVAKEMGLSKLVDLPSVGRHCRITGDRYTIRMQVLYKRHRIKTETPIDLALGDELTDSATGQ